MMIKISVKLNKSHYYNKKLKSNTKKA